MDKILILFQEAVVKRQERAKRFGIKEEKDQIQWNVEDLYNRCLKDS